MKSYFFLRFCSSDKTRVVNMCFSNKILSLEQSMKSCQNKKTVIPLSYVKIENALVFDTSGRGGLNCCFLRVHLHRFGMVKISQS